MSDFLNPHLQRPAIRWTAGDALPAIEQTGPAAPLLIDKTTGRLMVDALGASAADLSIIQGQLSTITGIETASAADIAAVKTQLATGSVAVTGGGGGGGGVGGASAAYNATLPTYTSGASSTLQTDVNGRLITTGGLTDTQLRASPVPVSASTMPLPSGAATSANQTTGNTSLSTIATNTGNIPVPISGRIPVDGSGVTQPVSGTVAISGTVPVSGTFYQATQPVSGTVTANVQGGNSTAVKVDGTAAIQLGSGVVTATTQRVTLATDGPEVTNSTAIKNSVANIPAKGAATIANSTPVNIASDQTVPVSLASVPSHAVTNAGTFAVQPSAGDLTSGNAKTQIVNGANTLAVNSDGSIVVNGNLGPALTYTATGAVSINTLAINSTDVSAYRTVSVQVSSLGSGGTIAAELSNDNSTWVIAYVQNDINSTNGIVSSFNAAGIWRLSTNGARYFRIRFSVAQTSGTTTITAYPSFQPINPTIGSTTVSNTISVLPQVSQNFGFSAFHTLISASGTNATLVKNSTGVLGTCILTNTTAAVKYVKFFNSASAPTVGTSTPVIQFAIQANQTLDVSTAFVGMRFSAGISYAITAGSALLDTTAVAAGDILVNITYV
jgi:hypothetical protein